MSENNTPLRGSELIARERQRQVDGEGYTLEGDRAHGADQLLRAAQAYMTGSAALWPWPSSPFKPGDRRRDLTKAGALVAAALDVELARNERPE